MSIPAVPISVAVHIVGLDELAIRRRRQQGAFGIVDQP
jgi:hypothetical protein